VRSRVAWSDTLLCCSLIEAREWTRLRVDTGSHAVRRRSRPLLGDTIAPNDGRKTERSVRKDIQRTGLVVEGDPAVDVRTLEVICNPRLIPSRAPAATV